MNVSRTASYTPTAAEHYSGSRDRHHEDAHEPSGLPDEIFYSIVQRKVIKPANFTDLAALEQRLLDFEKRYNATAKPFDWRYTKADLNAYLDRLATHEPLSPAA